MVVEGVVETTSGDTVAVDADSVCLHGDSPDAVASARRVADALRDLAGLPDPVGEVVRGSTLANGLQIRQVRVPMGVVGMIYEARPNVTVDAAGLGLKSGNAMILRGGSAAASTNRALVTALRSALEAHGLPADAVQLLEGDHDAVKALMTARGLVDLLIPRGGAGLIQTVVTESTVPVIETGVGNCHVYVDARADRGDAPGQFVAEDHRLLDDEVADAAVPVVVHVRSAHPDRGDLDEDLVIPGVRHRTVLDLQGADAGHDAGPHGVRIADGGVRTRHGHRALLVLICYTSRSLDPCDVDHSLGYAHMSSACAHMSK